jgi:hypothetical protein
MKTTLRTVLYGTTILAGLAVFVDGASAKDNKSYAGLRAGVPVSGSVPSGIAGNKRKAFVKARGSNLRNLTVSPTTGLKPGVSERIKRSFSGRSFTIPTVTFGQAQKPPRTSRDLRRLYAFPPLIQVPAADLGLTPASRKIEALRNKLGLESVAAVEGAGSAEPSTGGNPPADAQGGAGLVDSGSEAGPPDPAGDCIGAAAEGLPNPRGSAESGSGRRVPTPRVNALLRDIAEGAGWAPGLRPNSFRNEGGVWHGRSTEGHEADVIQGSSGITIAIYDRDEDTTTRYVYDRNEAGDVKLDHTEIEHGPDSSEPGMVETQYPDQSSGHGNTITHHSPPDSQPVDGASDGAACGEAAVRNEKQEAERNRNDPTRFRDPGPDGPSGVVTRPDDPPTQEELDDMTCQSAPDSDECRAHRGGSRPRRAQDFAQPGVSVEGPVIPGLSGAGTPDDAGEELVDPRPGGDPEAAAR